MHMVEDCNKVL